MTIQEDVSRLCDVQREIAATMRATARAMCAEARQMIGTACAARITMAVHLGG